MAYHSEKYIQSLQDLGTVGLLILNPHVGKVQHQRVNSSFLRYLQSHPMYLLQFVIQKNNTAEKWRRKEEASRIVASGFISGFTETNLYMFDVHQNQFRAIQTVARHGSLANESLHLFKRYLTRCAKYMNRRAMTVQSSFVLGRGIWTCASTFHIRPLTDNDKVALWKIVKEWSHDGKAMVRCCRFGAASLKVARPSRQAIEASLETANPVSLGNKHPGWLASLSAKKKAKFLSQFHLLEWINYEMNKQFDLYSPRQCWEEAFTVQCTVKPPCLRCRRCRMRFAQATFVVIAAQGTKDASIVPHFGAVFRHPRYQHFSIEEYASLSLEELTILFSKTSKQAQSAITILHFLRDFVHRDVPRNIPSLMCYHGFQKKSICLLLGAVGLPDLGIPVDRHLFSAFKNLKWVSAGAKNESIASEMVEMWLPQCMWGRCNVVVAGLRQIWGNRLYKDKLMAVAARLGPGYSKVLETLCQDLNKKIRSGTSTMRSPPQTPAV